MLKAQKLCTIGHGQFTLQFQLWLEVTLGSSTQGSELLLAKLKGRRLSSSAARQNAATHGLLKGMAAQGVDTLVNFILPPHVQ